MPLPIRRPVTMQAVVVSVEPNQLLVFDRRNQQRVIVHTKEAGCFHPGNLVRIYYDGVMTRSIPPQINADRIRLLRGSPCLCKSQNFLR